MMSHLTIKVVPHAKNNQLELQNEILKCRLQAPAVDGKANQALVVFLSKILKIPKSKIELLQGIKSRQKVLAFEGISQEELLQKVEQAITSSMGQ